MFGATVLVPLLTGLNPSAALFTAGSGTLLYILITGAQVPAFLGSSFAFIPAIIGIGSAYGMPYALGGAVVAGVFYSIRITSYNVCYTKLLRMATRRVKAAMERDTRL